MQNDTKQNEGKNTQKDVNEKKMMQNDTIEKVKCIMTSKRCKQKENDAKAKSEKYYDKKQTDGKNTQNDVNERKMMQNDVKAKVKCIMTQSKMKGKAHKMM